jgi:hypothetical protein
VIKIVCWSSCKEPIIIVLKQTLNHKPNSMPYSEACLCLDGTAVTSYLHSNAQRS